MFKKAFKGFTLIELLVVIAIIAILAAILFPVFAQAREKARATQCLSNTKQIALSVQLYADDYDETYPRSVSTPTVNVMNDNASAMVQILSPYIKNTRIFGCPSVIREAEAYSSPSHQYHVYANVPSSNMLWNGLLFVDNTSEGRTVTVKTLSELKNASKVVACIEGNYAPIWERFCYLPCWYGYWPNDFDGSYYGQGNTYKVYYIWGTMHNGGTNCAFMDGHAKYHKISSLTSSMFGFTKSDGSDRKYTDHDMSCNLSGGDILTL